MSEIAFESASLMVDGATPICAIAEKAAISGTIGDLPLLAPLRRHLGLP